MITVYGCGSPIRLPLLQNLASSIPGSAFYAEPSPPYRGGSSVVWGLIRGAKQIMEKTRTNGYDFWQVDNAYFGRENYFRVTKNGIQLDDLPSLRFHEKSRCEKILSHLDLSILDWRESRGDQILVTLSTQHLYRHFEITREAWLSETIKRIRQYSDRPIFVRDKMTSGIDSEILRSWILVTHTSASSLDALRLGVPVVVTGSCPAQRFSTPFEKIDSPLMLPGREELFNNLSWSQFSRDEFRSGFAWEVMQNM